MKRVLVSMMAIIMVMTLAACTSKTKTATPKAVIKSLEQKTDQAQKTDKTKKRNDILITYFTVPETDGVDTVSGASRVATKDDVQGNTEFIANEIQKNLGGDLFEIKTVKKYPETHNSLLEDAYKEKSDDARPKLATKIENLDQYDYIFIGYPNWNSDLPMPLYTFLEQYDFSGKTIIPFVTHGGSGFSDTIETIKELEPKADVVESGLSISRDDVADAQDEVKTWINALLKDE